MRLSSSKQIGIAFLLTGIVLYCGSARWLFSRKLIPLNVPISLSQGRFTAQEFQINLDANYYIEIEVEQKDSLKNLECLMWGCYEGATIIHAKWALKKQNEIEALGSSDQINGGSGPWGL